MFGRKTYGISALLEAVENADREEKEADELTDNIMGISEAVTLSDAIDAGLVSEDPVENDMDVDDVELGDDELEALCNKIEPIDDEDTEIAELDEVLESVLEKYNM